jgi:hypothetical protein
MSALTSKELNEQYGVDQTLVQLTNVLMRRKVQYPSIEEQLDDLFHQGAFSEEMTARIQAVKDANPKMIDSQTTDNTI